MKTEKAAFAFNILYSCAHTPIRWNNETMLRWGFIHRSRKCEWSSHKNYSSVNVVRQPNEQGNEKRKVKERKRVESSRMKLMHSFSRALADSNYSTNNTAQLRNTKPFFFSTISLSCMHWTDWTTFALHFPRDVNGNNEMLSMWTYQEHISSSVSLTASNAPNSNSEFLCVILEFGSVFDVRLSGSMHASYAHCYVMYWVYMCGLCCQVFGYTPNFVLYFVFQCNIRLVRMKMRW